MARVLKTSDISQKDFKVQAGIVRSKDSSYNLKSDVGNGDLAVFNQLNPSQYWTQPTNPKINATATVLFDDGLAYFHYDGVAWVFDYFLTTEDTVVVASTNLCNCWASLHFDTENEDLHLHHENCADLSGISYQLQKIVETEPMVYSWEDSTALYTSNFGSLNTRTYEWKAAEGPGIYRVKVTSDYCNFYTEAVYVYYSNCVCGASLIFDENTLEVKLFTDCVNFEGTLMAKNELTAETSISTDIYNPLVLPISFDVSGDQYDYYWVQIVTPSCNFNTNVIKGVFNIII